jgi:predicted nucleotidyltransferase
MSKTALDLTPSQWQAYQPAKISESYSESHKRQLARRRQQAMQVARQAARLLRERFQAQRVVLFGSLVHEASFTPWSDIDLAAWGIPTDRIYAAVAAVTGLSPDFKIDLVDPGACRPALQSAIERDGVEL